MFAAVAAEAGHVIPAAGVALVGRYDLDEESIEFVGAWSSEGEPDFVGRRVSLGGYNVATRVSKPTSRHVLIDSFRQYASHGASAQLGVFLGWRADPRGRSAVGSTTVGAENEDELPPGTEYGLAEFAELVASTISNTQARRPRPGR